MTLRRLVAVCCVMPVLLVGCSSPSEQFRNAAGGCMGSLVDWLLPTMATSALLSGLNARQPTTRSAYWPGSTLHPAF